MAATTTPDLLVAVVDLSPAGWARLDREGRETAGEEEEEEQQQQQQQQQQEEEVEARKSFFDRFLESLTVFLHAHVLAAKSNAVAVICTVGGRRARTECLMMQAGRGETEGEGGGDGEGEREGGNSVSALVQRLREKKKEIAMEIAEELAEAGVAGEEEEEEEEEISLAAALSMGLCYVNRRMADERRRRRRTGRRGGAGRGGGGGQGSTIPALLDGPGEGGLASATAAAVSAAAEHGMEARLWVVTVSADISSHYNAMMNCLFSAHKLGIIVDSTVLSRHSSLFLQQASYLTKGIYLEPKSSQELLQLWTFAHLPAPSLRSQMCLPSVTQVDFRASCFCHGWVVDRAYMCTVCLSLFCERSDVCPVCGTRYSGGSSSTDPVTGKRIKARPDPPAAAAQVLGLEGLEPHQQHSAGAMGAATSANGESRHRGAGSITAADQQQNGGWVSVER